MGTGYNSAENETVLYKHFDSSIIITDKRIRYSRAAVRGLPSYSSMLLDDVTSIFVRTDGQSWLLVTGLITGILGISAILEFHSWGLGGLMMSAALLVYYYSSRQQVIEFRRPEGVIKFPTTYLSDHEVLELVNKIENLKFGDVSTVNGGNASEKPPVSG